MYQKFAFVGLILFFYFDTQSAFAASTKECNERIRTEIIKSAEMKCGAGFSDLFWSEKELRISEDNESVLGGFSFKCSEGKHKGRHYIGVVGSTLPPYCKTSNVSISHATPVQM